MLTTTQLELAENLKNVFHSVFKDSYIKVGATCLSGSLAVSFTLGNGKDEYCNGISQNDLMHNSFCIFNDSKGFEMDFKPYISSLKPVNVYHYCRTEKISARIIRGDSAKIIASFEKTLLKLKARLIELNKNNEVLDVKEFDLNKKLV